MSGSGTEIAIATVLRLMVRTVAPMLLFAALVMLVRDLFGASPAPPVVAFVLVAGLGLLTGVAFKMSIDSLPRLRAVELALFATAAAYLVAASYPRILQELMQGDAGLALSSWNTSALQFVLLVVVYGIFIPNDWRRAALVVVPLAAVPVVAGLVLRARHPELSDAIAAVATSAKVTDQVLLLLAGAAVAVLAALVLSRYLASTFDARDMGVYDLREQIGAGGMGDVWLAEHRMLARPAAIKLIKREMLEDGDAESAQRAIQRFEREARATANLRSPHTIELYDFGTTRDGTFYYVMEYLDGLSFEDLIERHGPLPYERVIYLLQQVCESLGDAHRQGLIHRDIKPANLQACRMGLTYDYVKVLDFGLVKTERKTADSPKLTLEGTTTGTPAFMPPEMAIRPDDVDARGDIYALGCVGYWLLTGKLLFDADTPMGMMIEHAKTPPAPPSQRTEIGIPEQMDRAILKCLEKDPADRYQSTHEFADALAACPQKTPWDVARAAQWWELHQPEAAAPLQRAS